MQKIWNWNKFYGGISDNIEIGAEGQYQDGIAVDVQSEMGVKLGPARYGLFTTTQPVRAMYDMSSVGYATRLFGTEDGKIYNDSGTLLYTLTAAVSNKRIISIVSRIESGNAFVYVFTPTAIHKFSVDFTSTVSENYKTYTYGSLDIRSPIVYADVIYFISKNVFYSLDTAGVLTAKFTGASSVDFTGLTFFQDTFKIYGSVGSSDGIQYVLSTSDLTIAQYAVEWRSIPVLGAVNIGATDYVVGGSGSFYSDLYAVSGTQRQLIVSDYEGSFNKRSFSGKMTQRIDDVFIMGTDGINNGVYRYGKNFAGFKNALTCLGQAYNGTNYTCMATGNALYVSQDIGGVKRVSRFSLQQPYYDGYESTGSIVSHPFDGGNPHEKKNLLQIDVAYDCSTTTSHFSHGGTFSIYARKKPGDAWTLLGTKTAFNEIGNLRIDKGEISTAGFGDFHRVEFKISLQPMNQNDAPVLSPLIKGVRVRYDDNIQ